MPVLEFDNCTLEYQIGDCLELMKDIPDKSIDLVLTDPPYAVDYAEWDVFNNEWFVEAMRIGKTLAFTSGHKCMYKYPEPNCIIALVRPGSIQLQKKGGGFSHWEPVLVYGDKLPNVDMKIIHAQTDFSNEGHPCSKGLDGFVWLCEKLSKEGDTILDCFLGSGTTLQACRKTGRNGIGFEINPDYEPIIRKRIMADTKTIWQFGGE